MVSPALRQALDTAKARYGGSDALPEDSWDWEDEHSDDMTCQSSPISEHLIGLGLRKATKRELIEILRSSLNIELLSR
jgi:hypothetical protein